ncbi:MAG: sulfatase family protein [Solirubrobacterales bacterium]
MGFPLLAAIAIAGLGAAPAPAQERPNVILIQTDDQSMSQLYALSTVSGTPQVAMPNTLTLIAGGGITFNRYYVSDPLCCPSRATALTGQYAHNNGVLGNGPTAFGGYGALSKQHNLAVWLQGAGYRTIHIGKFLNYYGQPPVSAPTEVPPGWSHWETLAGEDSTHYFYGYRLNVNGEVRGPFGEISYARRDEPGCVSDPAADPCEYQTDVLTQSAVEQVLGSAGPSPFFLSLDYVAPHGDFRPPWGAEPAPRHYDSWSAVPLPRPPGFNERDVSDKPRFLRRARRLGGIGIAHAQQEWQKGLESLRAVDDGVARLFGALAGTGELARTYVIFTTDNGFFNGEHRIQRSKFLPYEPATHVPLLMRGPGIRPGSRSGELVANVDLAPTILQIAGTGPSVAVDGRSLLRFARKPRKRTTRPLLLEGFTRAVDVATARATGATASIRDAPIRDFQGIRVGRYKYVRYRGGVKELYDLRRDPYEQHSRIKDRRYREVRSFLAKRLNWLRRCSGRVCRKRLKAKIPRPLPKRAVRKRGPDRGGRS